LQKQKPNNQKTTFEKRFKKAFFVEKNETRCFLVVNVSEVLIES